MRNPFSFYIFQLIQDKIMVHPSGFKTFVENSQNFRDSKTSPDCLNEIGKVRFFIWLWESWNLFWIKNSWCSTKISFEIKYSVLNFFVNISVAGNQTSSNFVINRFLVFSMWFILLFDPVNLVIQKKTTYQSSSLKWKPKILKITEMDVFWKLHLLFSQNYNSGIRSFGFSVTNLVF